MTEFFVKKDDLENAMQIASLATEATDAGNQSLFSVNENELRIISTDQKTRLARTTVDVNLFCGDAVDFTSDPRKILSLDQNK